MVRILSPLPRGTLYNSNGTMELTTVDGADDDVVVPYDSAYGGYFIRYRPPLDEQSEP